MTSYHQKPFVAPSYAEWQWAACVSAQSWKKPPPQRPVSPWSLATTMPLRGTSTEWNPYSRMCVHTYLISSDPYNDDVTHDGQKLAKVCQGLMARAGIALLLPHSLVNLEITMQYKQIPSP